MLYPVRAKVVNRNGTLAESKYFLYYDSTVRDYSEDHFPFAVVSVCIVLVFVVLPTFLLILYPTVSSGSASLVFDGMHYTLSWKHFRDSTRMEPMVHETSE